MADLRERLLTIIGELVRHLECAGINWNDTSGTELNGDPLRLWDEDGESLHEHPWIQGQCSMRKEAARITRSYLPKLEAALASPGADRYAIGFAAGQQQERAACEKIAREERDVDDNAYELGQRIADLIRDQGKS